MRESPDSPGIERALAHLKESLEAYTKGRTIPTPEVLADLSKGIHELGDHMIALHRRLEKLEANAPEWSTGGWRPPPGSDQGSFVVRED